MQISLMERAIELAVESVTSGRGGPFAAVIARGGVVIAEATNLVTVSLDPTAHAEMIAIRNACRTLGDVELVGCDIYTTCEPCFMCLGAILWAKPTCVFYGCTRRDAAAAGFDDAFMYEALKLPPGSRSVPLFRAMRRESLAVFKAWEARRDRPRSSRVKRTQV